MLGYDGEKEDRESGGEKERKFKINIASEQLFTNSFVSSNKYFLLNLHKLHSAQLSAKIFPCQTRAGLHQTFVKSKFGWGKKSPEYGERARNTAG